MTKVTIEHVRDVGRQHRGDDKTFCAAAIRHWCKRNGIDYLQLVREGVDADVIRATDEWGVKLADRAEREGENHG